MLDVKASTGMIIAKQSLNYICWISTDDNSKHPKTYPSSYIPRQEHLGNIPVKAGSGYWT